MKKICFNLLIFTCYHSDAQNSSWSDTVAATEQVLWEGPLEKNNSSKQ